MTATAVIHIVDDDAAIRDSLELMLGSVGFVALTYESAADLLARVDVLEPGCIVTDVRMPGMNGLELVGRLKELRVPHAIVVLTGHADVPLAVEAMKAGVSDFLEKPFEDEALLRAIRTALQSGRDAGRQSERAELAGRLAQLTPREREVFDAIVQGDSNKAAARRLGISPRTVEIYRANVMGKMQAHSLSELVRMALRCES